MGEGRQVKPGSAYGVRHYPGGMWFMLMVEVSSNVLPNVLANRPSGRLLPEFRKQRFLEQQRPRTALACAAFSAGDALGSN